MKTIPVYEAKNRFSELLAMVEGGETICITRRGKPVVRLIAEPIEQTEPGARRHRIAAALSRLRDWRVELEQDADIKAIAREGAR